MSTIIMLTFLFLWIFCFPTILYYSVFTLTLILLFIWYKMSQPTCIASLERKQFKLHSNRTPKEAMLAMFKGRKIVMPRSTTTTTTTTRAPMLTTNPSYHYLALVVIIILSLTCTSIFCLEQVSTNQQ